MNKRILKTATAFVAATMIASGTVALSYNPAAAHTYAATAVAQAEEDTGVLVARVEANGPAAKAGLRRGDIVLSVNGKTVADEQALRDALSVLKPGASVEIGVDRGGTEQTLTVTLGDRDGNAYLGISPAVSAISVAGDDVVIPNPNAVPAVPAIPAVPAQPDEQTQPAEPALPTQPLTRTHPTPGMPVSRAFGQVLVTGVITGSPAAEAGLKKGDVISAVDGQALSPQTNLAEVIAAKKPGDTVTLDLNSGISIATSSSRAGSSAGSSETMTATVESGSKSASTRTVTVTLGTNPDKAGAAWLGIQYRPAFMIMTEEGAPGNAPGNVPGNAPSGPNGTRPLPRGRSNRAPGQAGQAGQAQQGAWVASVVADSPASEAGLVERDLIVEFNGVTVTNADAVVKGVQALKVGDVVTLTVMRGNERQEIKVTLGDNPNDAGTPYMGVELGSFSFRTMPGAQEGGLTLPFELDANGMPNLDDLLNQMRQHMPDAVPATPGTPGTTPDGAPSQGNL